MQKLAAARATCLVALALRGLQLWQPPASAFLVATLGNWVPEIAPRDGPMAEAALNAAVGPQPIPTVPFRYASVPRWVRTPVPTLGRRDRDVLASLLQLSDAGPRA